MDQPFHEFEQGLAYLAAGQWSAAAATLADAARRQPGQVAVVRALATACLQINDHQGARQAVRALTLDSPLCAEGWRLSAQLEWKLGRYDDAMAILARGLELLPHSQILQRQKAIFWGAQGKAQRTGDPQSITPLPAQPHNEDWLDRVVQDSKLLESILNSPQGENDRAMLKQLENKLSVLLESQPYHADRQFNLARLQMKIGAMPAALLSLQRALHSNPNYIEAHRLRATILAQMGEFDQAIEVLETLIRTGSNWPDIHYQLAELQCERGQKQEARQHLYSAISLNPKFERARALLEKCAA